MNGGCLHLSTGGVHQRTAWFMLASVIRGESLSMRASGGTRELLPKTGLWTGVLLEELSGLTTVAFRDTAIKFVCSHTQPALLASLVLWLRQTRFTLEEDTSLVKILRIMAGVTFWLLPFTVSETHEKKSDWIYFIWQCEDRSQRRNLKDENSPKP